MHDGVRARGPHRFVLLDVLLADSVAQGLQQVGGVLSGGLGHQSYADTRSPSAAMSEASAEWGLRGDVGDDLVLG